MVVIDSVLEFASAFRPPEPVGSRSQPAFPVAPFAASMALGPTPASAFEQLQSMWRLPAVGRVLVMASVASRPGRGAHPHAVATLLRALDGRALLAIPARTPLPVRTRWTRLASECNATPIRFGDSGWMQVLLPDRGYRFESVMLPADLESVEHAIAVTAIGDETPAIGFLRTVSHPHTALRARRSADVAKLDAEIATAARVTYILDGSRLPGPLATNLAVVASDPLSAELVALAIRRYVDLEQGRESSGSWEQPQVQAATELGLGPSSGTELTLHVDEPSALSRFIAGELGCTVIS